MTATAAEFHSLVLPEGVEKRVEIDFHDGSCEQGASPGLSRRAFGAHRRDALKNPNPPFRAPFGGWFEKP